MKNNYVYIPSNSLGLRPMILELYSCTPPDVTGSRGRAPPTPRVPCFMVHFTLGL